MLIGISEHGNRYSRKLFIHEARMVLHLVRDLLLIVGQISG